MSNKRVRGPRAIAAETARATAPIRRKRGFAEASVFSDWPEIVGPGLAGQCMPLRMVRGPAGEGATLHVRVTGPLALELQHLEPQVVERINGFYGYRAIARLRLHQGPITGPARPVREKPPVPDPEDIARLDAALAGVDDEDLRRALRDLGASVLARRTRAT
jgi:hypothetical protein